MNWLTAEEARKLTKQAHVIDDLIDDIMRDIEDLALRGHYTAKITFPRVDDDFIYEKVEEILEKDWGYRVGFGYPSGTSLEVGGVVEFQISWEIEETDHFRGVGFQREKKNGIR